MNDDNTYLLKADWQTEWQKVTKEEWVRAERSAGFRPASGGYDDPATGGFGGHGISGRIKYGPNSIRAILENNEHLDLKTS